MALHYLDSDMDEQNQNQQVDNQKTPFYKSRKVIISGVLLLIIFIGVVVFFLRSSRSLTNVPGQNQQNPVNAVGPDRIIAKVGKEYIYQKDLDYELSQYPDIPEVDAKEVLMKKLVDNSITLQSASEDKKNVFIQKLTDNFKLNTTISNSPQKDYVKRLQVIEEIKNQYAKQPANIQGAIVAIWFFNTEPAAIGYNQGKALAFSKITGLHDGVKSGKISIQQAGDMIKNDSTLAGVDSAYKDNAYLAFNVGSNEPIIFDSNFDVIIKGLKQGQITDVYLAKDMDQSTGQKIDAVYLFGQVSSVNNVNTPSVSFEDWIATQAKNYEVTYY